MIADRAVVTTLVFAALASLPTSAVHADFVDEDAFPWADLTLPTHMAFLPDGRILVAEKKGHVRTILTDGTTEDWAFLDVTQLCYGIQDFGLLSVAIDPDFPANDWVYVLYVVDPNEDGVDDTAETDKYIRVSRYRYHPLIENLADLNSREDLIGATWPEGIPTLHTSHGAGTLRFAPDKTLLVSAGEGAHWEVTDTGGLDPGGFGPGRTDPAEDLGAFRARTVNSLAGKVLRIDKETGQGLPSNPYWDGDPNSDRSKVWAYGLRNPFRIDLVPGTGSTDPADGDPGVLLVGDVGAATYESVHVIETGGYNGGWPCYEGVIPEAGYQNATGTAAGNTDVLCDAAASSDNPDPRSAPKLWWHHWDPDNSNPVGWVGASITAGTFYTGTNYPAHYQGAYAVADFVGRWIRWVTFDADYNVTSGSEFLTNVLGPVNLVTDPVDGDLYYVAHFTDKIRHIRWEPIVSTEEPEAVAGPVVVAKPNPFRGPTAIAFELAAPSIVSVTIFDAAGRHLKTLIEDRRLNAGSQLVDWDGFTASRDEVPPGTYFARVRIDGGVTKRKLVRVE